MVYFMDGATTAGTDSVVSALKTAITTDVMFDNLAKFIPVIGGVIIFAFTYRIVKKIVGGAQKGKARV